MEYIKLQHIDSPVSIFDICQAHAQLESDYNKDGILWERPSNKRRNASTGVQLHRMHFSSPYNYVNICENDQSGIDFEAQEGDDVRAIYMINVLKWDLPIDQELCEAMQRQFVPEFLATFPAFSAPQH